MTKARELSRINFVIGINLRSRYNRDFGREINFRSRLVSRLHQETDHKQHQQKEVIHFVYTVTPVI